MDRTAHTVTARLREIEHFLVDSLASDGRIPVDEHGEYLVLAIFAATTLARIHRTDDYRVHDFEV
ncbi:MAG: hypothetical protein AW09_001028 [Candidatus Accumulibacter phosphatis]|uniref:Uncharacterized protein n=1 Tax=Candidatus Accumulibacter phosphatis TaxID=327160 RepID=A0A080LYA4_9PROT|nr:MAG: hypothetical protein AW09_001028 [Candidatus Accumulibacter phosphatis]